jgi:hypothetical protein
MKRDQIIFVAEVVGYTLCTMSAVSWSGSCEGI